jgi:hypothetical protein
MTKKFTMDPEDIAMSKAKRGAALAAVRESMTDFAEIAMLIAKRSKIQYDAYIKAGFTEDQALSLVRMDGGKS